jgi:hypothetical protein
MLSLTRCLVSAFDNDDLRYCFLSERYLPSLADDSLTALSLSLGRNPLLPSYDRAHWLSLAIRGCHACLAWYYSLGADPIEHSFWASFSAETCLPGRYNRTDNASMSQYLFILFMVNFTTLSVAGTV